MDFNDIEKIISTLNSNEDAEKKMFMNDIARLSSLEFYQSRYRHLLAELMKSIPEAEKEKLQELVDSVQRIQEFHLEQAVTALGKSVSEQIKHKFGDGYKTDLVVKYKYANTGTGDSVHNRRATMRTEFEILED